MNIQHFFDEATSSLTYVVDDGTIGVVIDPVRDYDPNNARTSWESAEHVARFIDARGISIPYVIDTHAHADHLTGLPFFKDRYGAKTVTGARIGEIQKSFRDIYDFDPTFPANGSQFDVLVDEGQRLTFGSLQVEALHTPGHTPAHMSWRILDVVFVGDTLFMPDYGSARCDFPGGSAAMLFDSIQRLYAMPDETRLFMCHDYRPDGRPLAYHTTVGEQKRRNIQISERTTREEYIAFRAKRDATLAAPRLILPSVQVNICAGELPSAAANGTSYLKIPLNRLGATK
ncbi:MAG: glyoxylase-like metal-dependent hydrolase (beta-lactamase superfamily II) [Hyphomicrobiaceae bacterium]|jgi:glyoxylase-like metal-dependent hydrolase (beta-lactamase superfamily II)